MAGPVGAYVASSPNYRLQADSVNFGGSMSSSTNYKMEDTLGEIGTGTSSDAYNLHAGYQAMSEDVYLTVSSPSDVTLSPAIDASGGGTSDGTAVWTITTNSPAGYSLTLSADASPALRSAGGSFTDLPVTVAGTPDFSWSVPTNQAYFGYTAEGSDVATSFLDNGTTCGTGALETTDRCWLNFSTSAKTISLRNSNNNPSGTATTIKLRAQAGASSGLSGGTYQAVVSIIAIAL
ncbi:MAG: hypothetical protein UV64_C0005G0022 [Parcubacteria group bacterium GW2011_GWC1_43_11b]|nr:MAG: hypothetical protein UV50_C0002G0038 [Parcubacteria group bacterium GW2011_GWB1_42_9]KKS89503.1 MAG: hypothetical protein UV64_C0005G0022 [Parcubacteria group bacterium GW2011_GWC1_43_11b]KKT10142.1 MAG: hypothetical protein UV88_C0001G0038 [Parcubacteria group bacterium GW2011_GWA1_43_21]